MANVTFYSKLIITHGMALICLLFEIRKWMKSLPPVSVLNEHWKVKWTVSTNEPSVGMTYSEWKSCRVTFCLSGRTDVISVTGV